MELTPEEQFNAEPPEKMIPRMFAEGFEREAVIETLIQLAWPPEEATYLVDAYLAKREGRPPPHRPDIIRNTPATITVLSAFGFVGAAMSTVTIVDPVWWRSNGALTACLLASVVIKTICYVGLLRMKRWAVIGYALQFVALMIPIWISGRWNPESCIFSLGVLAAGTAYWSHMK